jgi:hypothetical protein
MSLKRATVGTLQSKKLSTYKFSSNRLSLRRFPFPSAPAIRNYIEEVFSTYLYTGTGASQNITNEIDLLGKGGLVWIKGRSTATSNFLFDTERGVTDEINSDTTGAEVSLANSLTAFNANGFTVDSATGIGVNNARYTSWTFRQQPNFFDVVTFTQPGVASGLLTVNHSLGSIPGCIFIKRTNGTGNWQVYHRSTASQYFYLNDTAAAISGTVCENVTSTSFDFNLSNFGGVAGSTYVAYVFAHNAGGFGLTGTDNVISCGSYTSTTGATQDINLGYEPQWIYVRSTTSGAVTGGFIFDVIREMTLADNSYVYANSVDAEASFGASWIRPTATGFTVSSALNGGGTAGYNFAYIAIRRGPMRTPTDASKVFQPFVYTGTNVDNRLVPTGILTDMIMARQRDTTGISGMVMGDRLRGNQYLETGATAPGVTDADSLMTPTVGYGNSFSAMNGFGVGNDGIADLNASTVASNQVVEAFARAPGFFDVVTYTGSGVTRTVPHNLGAVPQMMWIKSSTGTRDWIVYTNTLGPTAWLNLNSQSQPEGGVTAFNNTAPTASVFTVGTLTGVNDSAASLVAYLFGSVPGVSKVSYYVGKGSGNTNQVDCGFTSGARFILIRSLLTSGLTYVYDSARGIVAGNDPWFALNSNTAENTSTDYIDPYSLGFEITSTAPENLNGSYADNWEVQAAVAGTLDILDIMYENGYWVFGDSGNNIRYSTSGYSWTTTSAVLTGVSTAINGVAYGNGLYLAVGDGGRISTSSNLTTWTTRTSGTASNLTSAAYAFGKYWACGVSGTVVSSTDGVTWSTVSIGTAQTLNVVKLLNGILVFAGNNGALVSSADGINFTVQNTGGATDDYYAIAYGNNLYVAMGNSGVTRTSPDLITWTSRSPGALSGNNIRGVVWTDNRFVAVATAGETGYSSDGITWSTGGSAGSTPPLLCVAYGNEMCILGNGDGDIYVSNPKFIYMAIA